MFLGIYNREIKFKELSIMNKGAITFGIMSAGAALAFFYMSQQPAINIDTEEGKETVSTMLTGTWVYSDTLCRGFSHYESVREFNFGKDLPPATISAIRLNSEVKPYSKLEDMDVTQKLNDFISGCDLIPSTEEVPVVIAHDNYSRARTFYYYLDTQVILTIDENGVMPLIKDKALFELPVYQGGPLNVVEKEPEFKS